MRTWLTELQSDQRIYQLWWDEDGYRDLVGFIDYDGTNRSSEQAATLAQFIVDACNAKESADEFRRATPNYHATIDGTRT